MTSRNQEAWALLRLLHYAKGEAERLGLDEAAQLLELPALSVYLAEKERFDGAWPLPGGGLSKKPAQLN